MALLEHDLGQVMQAPHAIIKQLRKLAPAAIANAYAEPLETQPDLLSLAALAHCVLEKNLPMAALKPIKGGRARTLGHAGAALSQRYPGLSAEVGNRLLLNSWALTLGLSQSLRIPDERAGLMQAPSSPIPARPGR